MSYLNRQIDTVVTCMRKKDKNFLSDEFKTDNRRVINSKRVLFNSPISASKTIPNRHDSDALPDDNQKVDNRTIHADDNQTVDEKKNILEKSTKDGKARCQALKSDGKQCSRPVSKNDRCWQH